MTEVVRLSVLGGAASLVPVRHRSQGQVLLLAGPLHGCGLVLTSVL